MGELEQGDLVQFDARVASKVLMDGEQYKHLSSDAKLAYMVLKDRLEYSLRNHWVDEDNHVYFIFTVQELQDLFNCATEKAVKIKKNYKQPIY